MIDTHCHIDLHDDPIGIAKKIQVTGTQCVAVTMLPSHFRLGVRHLDRFRNIHSALGLHPLRVTEGKEQIDDFVFLSRNCEFIGEIGLDYSREGVATKRLQLEVLSRIITCAKRGKFVSVHSRGAATDLLQILEDKKVGPVCFHYFTAGPDVAATVSKAGHYFSFNRRMLKSKHRELLGIIPRNRVLVESDGPFLTTSPVAATKDAYLKIAEDWGMPAPEAEAIIAKNFANCRTQS